MIDPTFNETITVYHQHKYLDATSKKNATEWIRTVYEECYYGTQKAENLNGNTLSQASSYVVKIPYNGTVLNISPGDIVVRGVVDDIIADVQGQRATDLINKYKPGCFTIRTVSANTKIPEDAHYKVTGV